VRIILKKRVNLKGAKLIAGFHGVGFVGYITVKYLTTNLKADLIGFIESKHLPPYVTMREDGRIQTPFELYYTCINSTNLVLILTEVPLNSRDIQNFAFTLSKWSIDEGLEEALLIGGLDSRLRKNPKEELRCVATSAYLNKHKDIKVAFLERGYYVVGPLALMLAKYEMEAFPAIAILPYANIERPDPRAAAIAVKYIGDLLNLQIDTRKLIEEAEIIEKELEEISRKSIEKSEKELRSLYV